MKNNIPKYLILSRLILGILIVILALVKVNAYSTLIVTFLTIGLLTDIFDGIIARKLNVSNESLRRLDSSVDQVFFIAVIVSSYLISPAFYHENWILLSFLIAAEVFTYVVSYLKFKKEIATHSIGAKIWTLILFSTLIQIILKGESHILFQWCFWIGVITRIEIIAIILILKNWTNDVPSVYHALQLRKGKPIKRNPLFNG